MESMAYIYSGRVSGATIAYGNALHLMRLGLLHVPPPGARLTAQTCGVS